MTLLHPWDAPHGVPCLSCGAQGCPHCGGTGTAYDIARADAPRNEIIPGLWQGGHSCTACLTCETWPAGFDLVIDMRRTTLSTPPVGCAERLQYAIPDARLTSDMLITARYAAAHILDVMREDGRVLVRCHWGLNRSGLVVGLVMRELDYGADETVDLIREKRSPWALSNSDFERVVRA